MQTYYLGSIGNDSYGTKFKECLDKDKVNYAFHTTADTPTGTCAVLVSEKERSLVANLGSACKFPIEHYTFNMGFVEQANILYFSSFFLTSNSGAAIEMTKFASEKGVPNCINLAAQFLIEFNKEEMMQCIQHAEYVFGNESEAEKFSEVHLFETKETKQIALKLAQSDYKG